MVYDKRGNRISYDNDEYDRYYSGRSKYRRVFGNNRYFNWIKGANDVISDTVFRSEKEDNIIVAMILIVKNKG